MLQGSDLSCLVFSEFPRSSVLFSFLPFWCSSYVRYTFGDCPPVLESSDLLVVIAFVVSSYFSLDFSLGNSY